MTGVRAAALDALHNLLQHTFASGVHQAQVVRNEPTPQVMEGDLLVAMSDGEQIEATAVLSPLRWQVQHEARVTIVAQGETPSERQDLIEDAIARLADAIAGDRTLDGHVEWCSPIGYSPSDVVIDGDVTMSGVTVRVALNYTTSETVLH